MAIQNRFSSNKKYKSHTIALNIKHIDINKRLFLSLQQTKTEITDATVPVTKKILFAVSVIENGTLKSSDCDLTFSFDFKEKKIDNSIGQDIKS